MLINLSFKYWFHTITLTLIISECMLKHHHLTVSNFCFYNKSIIYYIPWSLTFLVSVTVLLLLLFCRVVTRYAPAKIGPCQLLCIPLAYSDGLRQNWTPWTKKSGHCWLLSGCTTHSHAVGFFCTKTFHIRKVCNLREYFIRTDVNKVAVDTGLTPLTLA